MTATFVLELDTHAPQFIPGDFDANSNTLVLQYNETEPAVQSVEIHEVSGRTILGVVGPGAIVFDLGGSAWRGGNGVARMKDEVDNEADSPFYLPSVPQGTFEVIQGSGWGGGAGVDRNSLAEEGRRQNKRLF